MCLYLQFVWDGGLNADLTIHFFWWILLMPHLIRLMFAGTSQCSTHFVLCLHQISTTSLTKTYGPHKSCSVPGM